VARGAEDCLENVGIVHRLGVVVVGQRDPIERIATDGTVLPRALVFERVGWHPEDEPRLLVGKLLNPAAAGRGCSETTVRAQRGLLAHHGSWSWLLEAMERVQPRKKICGASGAASARRVAALIPLVVATVRRTLRR